MVSPDFWLCIEEIIWGIKTFGASAPYQDLAAHFGFVPDKLAAAIRTHVEQG